MYLGLVSPALNGCVTLQLLISPSDHMNFFPMLSHDVDSMLSHDVESTLGNVDSMLSRDVESTFGNVEYKLSGQVVYFDLTLSQVK